MATPTTLATLVDRVEQQHRETLRRFDETKDQLDIISASVLTHESRISILEAKQGFLIKLVLGVVGGGGIVGAGVYGLFNTIVGGE